MNKQECRRVKPGEAEDYTQIVVFVRGGCVQGARTANGTPVLVTVHDYDVDEADVQLPGHDIRRDESGEHFECLIA